MAQYALRRNPGAHTQVLQHTSSSPTPLQMQHRYSEYLKTGTDISIIEFTSPTPALPHSPLAGT